MISHGYPTGNTHAHSGSFPHSDASAPNEAVTLLHWLLAASALAAGAGVASRNVTAAALLVSNAFTFALCRAGVPFNFVLWVVVDLVVILIVIRPEMTRRDLVILALFAPIWALYILQPAWWARAVILTVVVQMLLTFPAGQAWALAKRVAGGFNERDDGMKLAAA